MPTKPEDLGTDLKNLRDAAAAVIRKIISAWDELHPLMRAIEKHHSAIADQVAPDPTPPKKERAEPKPRSSSGGVSAFPVTDTKI